MDKRHELIRTRLSESNHVRTLVLEQCSDDIIRASEAIAHSFAAGGKLLLCGNGGSAADCQHLAAEFVSRLRKDFERRALPALALTTDTSFITAYANDCGYEGVFARQIEALAQRGDIVLGISTSGSSPNIVRALKQASAAGCITIALVGEGGCLREIADITVSVPSTKTQYIQECHLSVEHLLCELVEETLFVRTADGTSTTPSLNTTGPQPTIERVLCSETSGESL
jgi:D-sedoheptulose 7-phosphate isomerase